MNRITYNVWFARRPQSLQRKGLIPWYLLGGLIPRLARLALRVCRANSGAFPFTALQANIVRCCFTTYEARAARMPRPEVLTSSKLLYYSNILFMALCFSISAIIGLCNNSRKSFSATHL